MVSIFDWLGDIITGIGNALDSILGTMGAQISNAIWDTTLRWLYNAFYDAAAAFFTSMGNMGADIFSLGWVDATIRLFIARAAGSYRPDGAGPFCR